MSDRIVIYGTPPSKANQYRIITISGHGSLCKTNAMKEYEQNFYMQCPLRDKMISGYFKIDLDVYYTSMRQDLDNMLKGVLDCLQQCRAIKNDNQCVEIHTRKFVDKVNPRIEFSIEEVEL